MATAADAWRHPTFRLRDLLLETDVVSGAVQRKILKHQLALQLGYPVPIIWEGADHTVAMELAQFCWEAPEERLEALRDVVAGLEKESIPGSELTKYIEWLLRGGAVGRANLEALKELLREAEETDIPGNVVKALFSASVEGFGPEPPTTQLAQLAEYLNDLLRPVATKFPCQLMAFTERLAFHLGDHHPDLRDELQRWADEITVTVLRDIRPRLRELRRDLAKGSPDQEETHPYLLLEFRPRGCDQGFHPLQQRYAVTAWLELSGEVVGDFRGEATARVVDAEQLVNQWLDDLGPRLGTSPDALTIEVFVPLPLLRFPVDQWPNTWREGTTIGQQYRIVVRGLDREQLPRSRWDWETKWAWLRSHPTTGVEPIRWVETEEEVEPNELLLDLTDERHPVIGLGLHFPPDVRPPADLLEVALTAGVPVVVWTRSGGMERFRQAVVEELADNGFDDLPGLVLHERKNAGRRGDGVGRHLALLWDDPGRWLPNHPLHEPRMA